MEFRYHSWASFVFLYFFRVECHSRLHLEHRCCLISRVDRMQLYLSRYGASSPTIGFGISIGRVKRGILSCNSVLESDLVLVVERASVLFPNALKLPVDFFILTLFLHSVDHWEQLCSQSKLSLFNAQRIGLNNTGNWNNIAAEDRIRVRLGGHFKGLPNLPIATKIVNMKASDRHNPSSSKKHIMRMHPQ